MMNEATTITTLRPWDPESLAMVVHALKAEGVEHRVIKSNEGYSKIPTTKYTIQVRTDDPDVIYRAMEGAACEIIPPEQSPIVSEPEPLNHWKPAIVFVIFLLLFILATLRGLP